MPKYTDTCIKKYMIPHIKIKLNLISYIHIEKNNNITM